MNQNLNLTSSVASKPHAHPRLPTGVLASRLKEAAGGTPVDNLSAETILPKNRKTTHKYPPRSSFNGIADIPPFESGRDNLKPPAADPLA